MHFMVMCIRETQRKRISKTILSSKVLDLWHWFITNIGILMVSIIISLLIEHSDNIMHQSTMQIFKSIKESVCIYRFEKNFLHIFTHPHIHSEKNQLYVQLWMNRLVHHQRRWKKKKRMRGTFQINQGSISILIFKPRKYVGFF